MGNFMEEKDLYPIVECFLFKNKGCIEDYIGNELSFKHFRTDVFGVSINDEKKRVYLLEGKLYLDGRDSFSKVISETSYLKGYADYIYIFGRIKDKFKENNLPSIKECEDKGIGILTIDSNNEIHEFLKAKKVPINSLNKKEALFRVFNKKFKSNDQKTYIADYILQATYEYTLNTSKKCAKFIDIYNELFSKEEYKELLRKILGGNHILNAKGMRGAFEKEYGGSYYIGIIKDKKVIEDQLCVNEKTLEKVKPPILLDNYKNVQSFGDIELIANIFAKHFAHWKIILPEEDIKNRLSGYIQYGGWLIQYCFGKDETGNEYLDYYASHRMTDDSHVRIYEDGRKESLPALYTFLLLSDDPIKAKQLKDEYEEHNHQVVKMLNEKGFDKFTINMLLHAGMDKEQKK